MATTNYQLVQLVATRCPKTFKQMRHLVTAMAKCAGSIGKKTIFGTDKGEKALQKFEGQLKVTLQTMYLEGINKAGIPMEDALSRVYGFIMIFKVAYPNWQDAYEFADAYFEEYEENLDDQLDMINTILM